MLLYFPLLPGETAQQIVPAAHACARQSSQCAHAMPKHGGEAPFAPQHAVPAGAPTGGQVTAVGGRASSGTGGAAASSAGAAAGAGLASVLASPLPTEGRGAIGDVVSPSCVLPSKGSSCGAVMQAPTSAALTNDPETSRRAARMHDL